MKTSIELSHKFESEIDEGTQTTTTAMNAQNPTPITKVDITNNNFNDNVVFPKKYKEYNDVLQAPTPLDLESTKI